MLDPSQLALRRTSTSDDVVEILRRTIVIGHLAPGTHLREAELASELGVSRPTLREALRSLQSDGLVQHHANRGVFVSALSVEEVEDLYRVRAVLESNAARICEGAPQASIDAIATAYERLRVSWDLEDGKQIIDADLSFHAAIVALLGSARLDAAFSAACDGLRFCLSLMVDVDPEIARGPDAQEQHAAMFGALSERRADEATRLVSLHVERNRERVICAMASRQDLSTAIHQAPQ